MSGRLKIGEMMLRANLIDQLQLNAALAHQRQWGGKLGAVMVELGFVDEEMLWKGLARQTGYPRADLVNVTVNAAIIQRIPVDVLDKHCIFPLAYRDDTKTLTVATADPGNSVGLDELTFLTRLKTSCALAPESEIQWAIRRYYKGDGTPCPPLRKKRALATDVDTEDVHVTDMAGNTVMKKISDIKPPPGHPAAQQPPPQAAAPFGSPASSVGFGAPGSVVAAGLSPEAAALKAEIEKGNKFLKNILEICITRGLFTQEEYLERLRR
jgi:hypothetical protein